MFQSTATASGIIEEDFTPMLRQLRGMDVLCLLGVLRLRSRLENEAKGKFRAVRMHRWIPGASRIGTRIRTGT